MKRFAWFVLVLWLTGVAGGCATMTGKGQNGYAYVDTRIKLVPVEAKGSGYDKGLASTATVAVVSMIADYGIGKLKEKAEEKQVTRVVSSEAVAEGKYNVFVSNGVFSSKVVNEGANFEKLKEANVVFDFNVDIKNRTGVVAIKPINLIYKNSMTDGWFGKRNLTVKISVTSNSLADEKTSKEDDKEDKIAVVVMSFEKLKEGNVIGEEWFDGREYIIRLPIRSSNTVSYTIAVELTEQKGESALLMNVSGGLESLKKSVVEEQEPNE